MVFNNFVESELLIQRFFQKWTSKVYTNSFHADFAKFIFFLPENCTVGLPVLGKKTKLKLVAVEKKASIIHW